MREYFEWFPYASIGNALIYKKHKQNSLEGIKCNRLRIEKEEDL